jgi:hypothetical protein
MTKTLAILSPPVQHQAKRAAFAELTFKGKVAGQQFREPLTEIKSQTGAFMRTDTGQSDLLEGLK